MPNPSKIRRRALRRPFETVGFRFLQWFIPLLPRSAVVGLSRLAGRIMWLLPLPEKRIGLKNIDAVFGDTKPPAEKRFILTSSFSTFCLTMLDMFWFSKNPAKRIPRYIDFEPNFDPFFQDKAHLFLTAHFGGWEVMGQNIALRGGDLVGVAATIKNKQVDALFQRMREQTGQTIIPQKGALRTLIARLRKKSKVGFVLDQHTSEHEGGITVDFLGLPMSVSAAPAALAYRTGTEIFFGFCMPQKNGKYKLYSPGTLQPPAFDKTADADLVTYELTQRIQNVISEEIHKHPEYWLWSYKHWRKRADGEYPDHYPDY